MTKPMYKKGLAFLQDVVYPKQQHETGTQQINENDSQPSAEPKESPVEEPKS